MYTETRIHIIPTLALEPLIQIQITFQIFTMDFIRLHCSSIIAPQKKSEILPWEKNISTQNSECISNIVGMMQKARASSKIKCKLWVCRAIALSFFARILPKVEGIAT